MFGGAVCSVFFPLGRRGGGLKGEIAGAGKRVCETVLGGNGRGPVVPVLVPGGERVEGGASGSDSDSDDGQQRCRKSNKGTSSCENKPRFVLSSWGHRDGGEGRMARVENATAPPLPYSAISGTGGSAGGRPQLLAWEWLSGVLPAAHGCGCGCSGRNPAAKQALALLKREVGSRRQGFGHTGRINCIRSFAVSAMEQLPERPRTGEEFRALGSNASLCLCLSVPGLIFPRG